MITATMNAGPTVQYNCWDEDNDSRVILKSMMTPKISKMSPPLPRRLIKKKPK